MALSLDQFRNGFPEFDTAADSLVQSKLAEAHRMFDEELYGENYTDAVGYMTAELLSRSPFGTNARAEGAVSTYQRSLEQLAALVPATPLAINHYRRRCPR